MGCAQTRQGAATAWLPPAAEWPCSIRSPKMLLAFAANPQHRGTMFRRLRHGRRQRAGHFPAGCAAPPGTPHCTARQPLPARGRAPGFRHRTQGYRTPARPADVPRQRQTVLRWRWHRAQAAPPPGPPRQPALRAPAQLPAGWVPHRAAQRRCSCTPRWYWPPRCRSMRSCNAWPLWNGSYSAMMPTKFISSPPDSPQILFACAEKSLAMFSASLYNKFV